MCEKKRCCCCPPCPCMELQPVVLFDVRQRAARSGVWDRMGYTIDLSTALAYQDSPRGAWISVSRGFMDKNGRLYNAKRERIYKVPAEYRP